MKTILAVLIMFLLTCFSVQAQQLMDSSQSTRFIEANRVMNSSRTMIG